MTKQVRGLLVLVAGLAVVGLASCGHYTCSATFGASSCTPSGSGLGGGSTTGSPAAFVYFADDNNGDINAALLDTAANFNEITGFTEPTFPAAIDGGMVVVQKQWLYMPLTSDEILGYSINTTTGALTALPLSPYPTSVSFSISSDPLGHFLFVAAEGGGVSVYQISQTDGSLTLVPGSPFATPGFAWSTTTDGLGKFLYVSQGPLADEVAAFSINSSTGALTPVPGSPFAGVGFNMSSVKGEASGKFLLGTTGLVGVNGEAIDNHIYVFNINQSTGAISPVSGSPFTTLYSPINIAVHPSGTFVYSFSENSSGENGPMEGFQISSTGTLTELSTSPFTSLSFEVGIGTFDQSGAYLFTHPVGSVGALAVDASTGALSSVSSVGIGSNFGWAPVDAQ